MEDAINKLQMAKSLKCAPLISFTTSITGERERERERGGGDLGASGSHL
jgi:hypothetical protein